MQALLQRQAFLLPEPGPVLLLTTALGGLGNVMCGTLPPGV